MEKMPNVAIVIAVCKNSANTMGIRFEEHTRSHWVADWAFKIKASSASKEGYDRTRIVGTFHFSESFPGCPYCGSSNFVQCSCGTLLCYNLGNKQFRCTKCGMTGYVSDDSVTSLDVKHDA
ncbi:MAG: hypothetical protein RLY14_3108 [Planctomycetota bacterium]|jgi:predicted nucleic-acid-binding Zn-ribbon protein